MKILITPNHVLLPCPRLYTLISTFPDATLSLQQILGTLGAHQHWTRLEPTTTTSNSLLFVMAQQPQGHYHRTIRQIQK